MLIRNAEVWRQTRADLRIEGERIAAIGKLAPHPGEPVLDAGGGALFPGLHDHHLHLMGLAARRASVLCGPPEVTDAEALRERLRAQPGEGWIRGVLYHESVMGLPDARALDRLVADRPLRIQHRGGRLWLLNSLALAELLARAEPPPGLEREGERFTGHLFDEDAWLRRALANRPPPLDQVGAELAALGVTGLTDMTPDNGAEAAAILAAERERGALPQHLMLAGTLALAETAPRGWTLGPAKLHLHEAALPDLDETIAFARAAHTQGRGVAVHCTTEVELVYALAVLEAAGTHRLDRIEHAGIARDEHVARIAAMDLAVVSQPHFIAERGERYLADVEPELHRALYRLHAFREAGVPLAAGSDAPFASADPWASMRAAVSRRTSVGSVIGAGEALSPEEALVLYLADPADLARQRRLEVGAVADLVLLDRPWGEARTRLSAEDVRATWIAGRVVHQRVDKAPVQCGPSGNPPA